MICEVYMLQVLHAANIYYSFIGFIFWAYNSSFLFIKYYLFDNFVVGNTINITASHLEKQTKFFNVEK